MKPAKKSSKAAGKEPVGFTDEERAAARERVQELKAEKRGRGPGGRGKRCAGEDRRTTAAGSLDGRAASCPHQSQWAGPFAEDLVRDARVCQGRQCRLLLPECAEV